MNIPHSGNKYLITSTVSSTSLSPNPFLKNIPKEETKNINSFYTKTYSKNGVTSFSLSRTR
uniref:Uncharacterized protein n=1 Tax=Human betaherpesvirus 6 TaxID=10368 RepID=A0A5P9U3X0_9BETA|nr:hypothetical protein [Human betaherpesvirus 6]